MDDVGELLPKHVQPYWAIWEAATGGGKAYEYIIWNIGEWSDFDSRHGLKRDHHRSDTERAMFGDELATKYEQQIRAAYGHASDDVAVTDRIVPMTKDQGRKIG